MTIRRVLGAVLVATLVIPGQAFAAPGDTVTLAAEPATVTFGDQVTLSGATSPPVGGQPVTVVEVVGGAAVASAVTAPDGTYAVAITPDRNLDLRADWGTASSAVVPVRVRAVVEASLGKPLLFGPARVIGRVHPAHAASHVVVRLLRRGKVIASTQAAVGTDGGFAARLTAMKAGKLRARVEAPAGPLLEGETVTGGRVTPTPGLGVGAKGKVVKYFERRLRGLGYHLLGVNKRFDFRTADAVLAFHKVQGMPRLSHATKATWRRLTKPRVPKPRAKRPKLHIEIDQTKQVLYVVKEGKIWRIVHTSTGAGSATRDGVFRVHRKIAGFSPGRLYYPSYFDGNRAVHGWPIVPTYNASHGCSRVPYWTAIWLHGIMGYGTLVRIYH